MEIPKKITNLEWETLDKSDANIIDDEGCPIIVLPKQHSSHHFHSHNFYEFLYVQEGVGLHYADNRSNLFMPGDLIFIPPGAGHSYRGKTNINTLNIIFLPEALGEDMSKVLDMLNTRSFNKSGNSSVLHISMPLKHKEKIESLINELIAERKYKPVNWKLRSKLLLSEIIILINRELFAFLSERPYDNPYMKNILEIIATIEKDCAKDITVKEIAASFGISPEHFSRKFKEITGFTPIEYMRRRRFAKALELLHTNKSVSEIAEETGFHQVNYFSREFKKLFNMTPTEFQKQCRYFV